MGTVTGASGTPSRAALAELTGRMVYLWPDHDDVGRKHMQRVAAGLSGVIGVEIVDWPDAPEHGGAADFLEVNEPRAVYGLTRRPALPSVPSGLPTVYSVRDLAALPSADEEYVIGDGILTRGGKLLLYGKAGAGKTTLLDFLAGPLATGRPFLGRFAIDRPRRVLMVQGELSLSEMASHAQQLISAGFDDDRLAFARMTDLKLPAGEAMLRRLIEATRTDVLMLDPWYRLFSGESSDKPEQVGTVFDVCDRLLDSGTIEAVVIAHHANVTGLRTAGSWMFEGWPSTILRIEKVAGIPDHRKLTFEKIRAPGSSLGDTSLVVALLDDGYLPVTLDEPRSSAGSILAVEIVREAGGQLHRAELVARLQARGQCSARTAATYVGKALQGSLDKQRDGNSILYRLHVESPADVA